MAHDQATKEAAQQLLRAELTLRAVAKLVGASKSSIARWRRELETPNYSTSQLDRMIEKRRRLLRKVSERWEKKQRKEREMAQIEQARARYNEARENREATEEALRQVQGELESLYAQQDRGNAADLVEVPQKIQAASAAALRLKAELERQRQFEAMALESLQETERRKEAYERQYTEVTASLEHWNGIDVRLQTVLGELGAIAADLERGKEYAAARDLRSACDPIRVALGRKNEAQRQHKQLTKALEQVG